MGLPAYVCCHACLQDAVFQPYEDLLPYHTFSVRVPSSRLPQLLHILRAIPDAEAIAMRQALALHWRAFVWHPDWGGQAYNYTIASLQQRLTSLLAQHYT
jgi:hypothetical protein